MDASVIIVTCNRAVELAETLKAFGRIRTSLRWELLVVDNHSSDSTRAVVSSAARTFPVELLYIRHEEPGKYGALNAAIRSARGRVIAATDDDAHPDPNWLDRAVQALDRLNCDFVGGPAFPRWETPPSSWLDFRRPLHAKVLGLLDHGSRVCEFGRDGIAWPLGVNVAYRRDAFVRVGQFNPRLGRKSGTLLNQSQREWHLRARSAGLRGFYIPDMIVHHLVPAERNTKRYFRRWFYWHGISRALLNRDGGYDIEEPERIDRTADRSQPFLGIPRATWRKLALSLRGWTWRVLRGNYRDAFTYELYLWFFAGVARQRLRDRKSKPSLDGHAAATLAPGSVDLPRV